MMNVPEPVFVYERWHILVMRSKNTISQKETSRIREGRLCLRLGRNLGYASIPPQNI